MSEIIVRHLEPERYAVEVREGHEVTNHKVAVHESLLDELGLIGVDPARVVRESVDFLLERETADGIWADFPLEQIAEHYPGYYDELLTRLRP